MNGYQILEERGFVRQVSNEAVIRDLLDRGQVTFYAGFDPTADSFHAGSLMPLMAMAHLQRAGHRPIAILGGGTAMVGDPSGKTELRQMLRRDQIRANGIKLKKQISHFLELGSGKAIIIDNADWLLELRYVDFLREIGRHFSVNRMLSAEAYKLRLEKGLSFLEFNYQLLQAYDYLILYQRHNCLLQVGGDDQWGNIVAGIDLIRRVEQVEAYGLTFPLLTTAQGQKMGKTAMGAVWLDPKKLSPYDYYQFWINTDDADVGRFLAYFTFIPIDEVNRLRTLQGAELREAKRVLAFEATNILHGEEAAVRARDASRVFDATTQTTEVDTDAIPTSSVPGERLADGVLIVELLIEAQLASSKRAARRLIEQGGAYINGNRVTDHEQKIGSEDFVDGELLLRVGKKRYHRVVMGG